MTRIYHALKKSEESQPNLLVQLIDGNHQGGAEAQAATCAVCAPEEPGSYIPAAEESDGIPAASAPEPAFVSLSGQEHRVVRLRIPSGVPIFPFDGTDVRSAEQYRVLRTNLIQHPLRPKVLAISSATSGDGKTITAINLAGIMALKSDHRVLIVDADLRRSTVAKALGIDAEPGLGDVLLGHCTLAEAVVGVEQMPKLFVLPAGRVSVNPAELLDSVLCHSTFTALREQFSYVIVDTTPMQAVADFQVVQQLCDSVVVVVRPDHTNRQAFLKALEAETHNKIIGTVVNASEDWLFWKARDNYGYYGEAPAPKKGRFWGLAATGLSLRQIFKLFKSNNLEK